MPNATPGEQLPPPPYPPEILSRGWKFDLDLDRIGRSETWILAPADLRPWLLMLWSCSWRNQPCGSFPDNDRVIAARIGMPDALFALQREILMRGWKKHSDGRLYHGTITEHVLEMIAHREADRRRQRLHYEKSKSELNQSESENLTREDIESSTGIRHSPSPSPSPKTRAKEKTRAPALAVADLAELPPAIAEEFIAHRSKRRAPLSRAAWDGIKAEAARAGWTPEQAVRKCLARGWTGFEAEWVNGAGAPGRVNGKGSHDTPRPRTRSEAIEARNRESTEEWLNRTGGEGDAAL